MAINFKLPEYKFKLPWFMYDIYNNQLITSQTIPGDIADNKDIFLTETPIPGLNYAPIMASGNGNRKINFTLPLLKRNNTIGNSILVKQFEILRNQATGFLNITTKQFTPNPKVLFYWGTDSLPLVWFVKTINFTHKQRWVNQQGYPQYSEVNIELWLDETDVLYKAEEMFRKVAMLSGLVITNTNNVFNPLTGRLF